MNRALAALLVVAACHSSPTASSDAGAPTATVAARATAGPPAPSASSSEVAPTLTGSKVKLALESGATLTLPAIATAREVNSAGRLPEIVKRAHVFELGGPKRLLMVNEASTGGKTCDATLDEELDRMKKAQGDTDPTRVQFRSMGDVRERKVGDTRVLYGDSMNRGLSDPNAALPKVAMATMVACTKSDYLIMMYTLDQPALPQGIEQMLSDIVASYSAPR
jgi:hypothetical protein